MKRTHTRASPSLPWILRRSKKVVPQTRSKPGLRAGDTLLFNARVRMPEDEGVNAVVLEHPGGATELCNIPPGGRVTYFRLPYTVTDEDVAANLVSVRFQARALGLSRVLTFTSQNE